MLELQPDPMHGGRICPPLKRGERKSPSGPSEQENVPEPISHNLSSNTHSFGSLSSLNPRKTGARSFGPLPEFAPSVHSAYSISATSSGFTQLTWRSASTSPWNGFFFVSIFFRILESSASNF